MYLKNKKIAQYGMVEVWCGGDSGEKEIQVQANKIKFSLNWMIHMQHTTLFLVIIYHFIIYKGYLTPRNCFSSIDVYSMMGEQHLYAILQH